MKKELSELLHESKILWNKVLDIIRNVKKLLDLDNIIELYIDMLSKF